MTYQKTNATEIIYHFEDIDVVILLVVVVISSMYDMIVRSRSKRDTNAKMPDEKASTTDGSGRSTMNLIVLSSL